MREEIIKIAQEAGLHIATDVNWMPIIGFEYAERFVKAVLANNPPQSYMSYQEGYAAGQAAERKSLMQLFTDPENQPTQHGTVTVEYMEREIAAEREACAKVCEAMNKYMDDGEECATAIRARKNT